jgi:hypothetical protein
MTQRAENPWLVEVIDEEIVGRLASRHTPSAKAVELGVDLIGDPHREDDAGHNWAVLSDARWVEDVVPGSAIIMGSSIGRYLAKVLAWDFEVSQDDPILTLELLPIRSSEVERLLGRNRTPAA